MNNNDFIKGIYEKYDNLDNKKDKFYKKNVIRTNHTKKYAIIITFVMIIFTSTITFSDSFINFFSNKETPNSTIAEFDNNYVQEIDMDYCMSNGVGFKVTQVAMDDFNLYLVFDIKLDEELDSDIHLAQLNDLLITDENNNVIFCNEENTYKEFCKENNIEYLESVVNSFKSNLIFNKKTNSELQFIFMTNTNHKQNICKNLQIQLNSITLFKNTFYTPINNNNIDINGSWKTKINLNKEKI